MAEDSTHREEGRRELLEMPTGARKLTTIGMAQKKPGLCACGEHPDPEEHAEAVDEQQPE